MQPTPGDVHVNTPLTNLSIAYIQNADSFVATKAFPNVSTQKQSDRYYVYDRGSFNRDEMRVRGPATESHGSGFTLDNTPTYFANVYAIHHDIPDQVRGNVDAVLNPDREAMTFVTQKALIKREKIWAGNFFATSKWTTEYAGVASAPSGSQRLQWNNSASTPIEDVRAAKTVVLQLTGFEPRLLVLGRVVFDKLLDHPEVIDRVKYGQTAGAPAMGSRQALAALFDVDQILVSNAIENTAAEGASASHSFILGKHAMLCYAAPAPGIMTPSAGYTFSWNGYFGAGPDGNRIKTFRMEQLAADRVELEMAFDMKIVSADLGVFFNGIVA